MKPRASFGIVTTRLMAVIIMGLERPLKFFNRDFIGQLFLKTHIPMRKVVTVAKEVVG
jgi:hypothetical protein